MRFLTTSTPWWRAVWKPNVSTCAGRSRSLSMVLGTCATRIWPVARSCTFIELYAVSSPPIDELRDPELEQRHHDAVEGSHVTRRVGARDAERAAAAEVDARDGVDAERPDGAPCRPAGAL